METQQLKEQINIVVEARERLQEATGLMKSTYAKWLEANELIIANESNAKSACQEAETKLRELALETYAETKDKAVAPGVGIRVMSRLDYDSWDAIDWAMEHKLALKLDTSAFEKIAKTSNIPFVITTEEPLATIASELAKVE